MNPVYPTEKYIFISLATLSALAWAALLVAVPGPAVTGLAIAAAVLVFVRSRYLAEIKGAGLKISENQSPTLHARLARCCEQLGITERPDAYLVRARRFGDVLSRWLAPRCVVLESGLADALAERPGALDFMIGRELGRIGGRHPVWEAFVAPASVLPLLGTAYRRARERRLDRYGAACCESDDDIATAIATIAAASGPARHLNRSAYLEQVNEARGLAMSFHELTSDSAWLTKRLAAALAFRAGRAAREPRPHALAWLAALLVPRLGPTQTGALGTVAKLGLVAAVAVLGFREYTDYRIRAGIAEAFETAQPVLDGVEDYALEHEAWPEHLGDLGYAEDEITAAGSDYAIAIHGGGIVGIDTGLERDGSISYVVLEPTLEDETFEWLCYGQDLAPEYLPSACR